MSTTLKETLLWTY